MTGCGGGNEAALGPSQPAECQQCVCCVQCPVSANPGRPESHNLARTKGCHGETGEKEDGTMVHPGTNLPSLRQIALLVRGALLVGLVPPGVIFSPYSPRSHVF